MRIAWSAAMLALMSLAGCGTLERETPAGTPVAAKPVKSTAEDLLAYLEPGDAARVKAALALSLALQSDDAEIAALADPVARREGADPSLRAMATLVQALAGERRRLKETAAAAQGRLRDERKLAESQKQRADTLQQKLDALTELEKSLAGRKAPAR